MKNLYNYTKALKEPAKVRQIKGYTISRNGIRIITIVIWLILEVVFYLVNELIPMVKIIGYSYYVFPFLIVWVIDNINVDGKGIVMFMYDYFNWKINYSMKKKTISYDEEVKYRKKNIRFK